MCDLPLGSLATALKGSRVAAMCRGDKGHGASPPPSRRGDSSCLLASALQGKAACFVTVLVPRRSGGTMADALQAGGKPSSRSWRTAIPCQPFGRPCSPTPPYFILPFTRGTLGSSSMLEI